VICSTLRPIRLWQNLQKQKTKMTARVGCQGSYRLVRAATIITEAICRQMAEPTASFDRIYSAFTPRISRLVVLFRLRRIVVVITSNQITSTVCVEQQRRLNISVCSRNPSYIIPSALHHWVTFISVTTNNKLKAVHTTMSVSCNRTH